LVLWCCLVLWGWCGGGGVWGGGGGGAHAPEDTSGISPCLEGGRKSQWVARAGGLRGLKPPERGVKRDGRKCAIGIAASEHAFYYFWGGLANHSAKRGHKKPHRTEATYPTTLPPTPRRKPAGAGGCTAVRLEVQAHGRSRACSPGTRQSSWPECCGNLGGGNRNRKFRCISLCRLKRVVTGS